MGLVAFRREETPVKADLGCAFRFHPFSVMLECWEMQLVSGEGSTWFQHSLRRFSSLTFKIFLFSSWVSQYSCSHFILRYNLPAGRVLAYSCASLGKYYDTKIVVSLFPAILYKQDQQVHCIWDSPTPLPLLVIYPASCSQLSFLLRSTTPFYGWNAHPLYNWWALIFLLHIKPF